MGEEECFVRVVGDVSIKMLHIFDTHITKSTNRAYYISAGAKVRRAQGTRCLCSIQGGGVPGGATSAGGVGGSVTSASLLKLQQQQQQQTAVPLQQQQPSTNAPQPPFNQVNYQAHA